MKADRKLTLVGLRIVGLCVIAYAIVTFGNNLISGGMNLYVVMHAESMGPTLNPDAGMPDETQRDMESRFQMERRMKKAIHQINLQQDLSRMIWSVMVFFVGLYMCRRGELLLQFLGATQTDSQPASGG